MAGLPRSSRKSPAAWKSTCISPPRTIPSFSDPHLSAGRVAANPADPDATTVPARHMTLEVSILGAGAGGGLPQWNCGCDNCRAARGGRIPAMTQSSIAATGNGRDWAIVNASPDIRGTAGGCTPAPPHRPPRGPAARRAPDQRRSRSRRRPSDPSREPALHALRHRGDPGDPLREPVFAALAPEVVTRRAVPLEFPFELAPGLEARLFAVPGKVPLYLEGASVSTDAEGEQTVGRRLRADGGRAFYMPGCAA